MRLNRAFTLFNPVDILDLAAQTSVHRYYDETAVAANQAADIFWIFLPLREKIILGQSHDFNCNIIMVGPFPECSILVYDLVQICR